MTEVESADRAMLESWLGAERIEKVSAELGKTIYFYQDSVNGLAIVDINFPICFIRFIRTEIVLDVDVILKDLRKNLRSFAVCIINSANISIVNLGCSSHYSVEHTINFSIDLISNDWDFDKNVMEISDLSQGRELLSKLKRQDLSSEHSKVFALSR